MHRSGGSPRRHRRAWSRAIFFAKKMITINPASDKTTQKIIALSKSAKRFRKSSALTEIDGVLVTIHSTKFETAVDCARFSSLNVTEKFRDDLWIFN
jgi:hypothetical protein